MALDEVMPAFGISEKESIPVFMAALLYSPLRITSSSYPRGGVHLQDILQEGKLFVEQVRTSDGAHLIFCSFPWTFTKRENSACSINCHAIISPEAMTRFNESANVQHISKISNDLYKNPPHLIVLANIERILDSPILPIP